MDEKTKIEPVPYIVYESAQARSERVNKRLTIALVVAIILIFLSNALWLNAWMQYEYVDDCETVTVDAGSGTANYIGNDGDITNGEDNSNKEDQDSTESERK